MPEPATFAIVTMADLELGAALIADPGARLRFKDPRKWESFGERLALAMARGERIRVVTAYADGIPEEARWRLPLEEAPSPWRERIAASLAAIARRHDRTFRPSLVEFAF